MPRRVRGERKTKVSSDHMGLVNDFYDLRIPEGRLRKAKKGLDANREAYRRMESVPLDKSHEPTSFMARLIRLGEDAE